MPHRYIFRTFEDDFKQEVIIPHYYFCFQEYSFNFPNIRNSNFAIGERLRELTKNPSDDICYIDAKKPLHCTYFRRN
jgi:hypothetical protein